MIQGGRPTLAGRIKVRIDIMLWNQETILYLTPLDPPLQTVNLEKILDIWFGEGESILRGGWRPLSLRTPL
jgi:hypothetical protein